MMVFFLLMALALMGAISLLTLKAIPQVFGADAARWLRRLAVLFDGLAIVFLVAGPFAWQGKLGWPGTLLQIAAIGVVTQLFFALLVGLGYLWQRAFGLRGNAAPYSASRRRLLKHAAAYPLAALAGGLYGGLYERQEQVVREIMVPVRHLPASLRGLRVAQLSDVHLGWFFGLEDLRALLEQTLAGAPDLLVLTGDIFDNARLNPEAAGLVDSYAERFPLGIWFVYGNHEHFRGIEEIDALLAGTRIHRLMNEAAAVEGAAPLYLAGVDFPMEREDEAFHREKAALAEQAFAAVPQGAVTLFLAHHPEGIDDGAAHGAALVLTGHTHGGQFGLFGRSLLPVFKYNRGIVRLGETFGYVHSGNGSWFPFRIGCPPEIAFFTLRRA